MNTRNVLLLSLVIFLYACSTSKEVNDVWVNKEKATGKTFHNIFIVALTADIDIRTTLEKDLAAAALTKGFKAVKSMDVLVPSLQNPKMPTKEEVVNAVKASDCDAVLITSLLKKEDDVKYTPEKNASSIGTTNNHVGGYYGYYSYWYPSVYSPAYYSVNKKYFIQTNLYEVASEEIMWKVESKVFNPTSLEGFSRSYITGLMKQLEKAKPLKK